jgi:hypothetical protein
MVAIPAAARRGHTSFFKRFWLRAYKAISFSMSRATDPSTEESDDVQPTDDGKIGHPETLIFAETNKMRAASEATSQAPTFMRPPPRTRAKIEKTIV